MRNGLERYFAIFRHEATTTDLLPYFDQLTNVGNMVGQLVFAIELGALIGASIAVTAVFFNVIFILYDYKKRVLLARKGIFEFKRKKIAIQASSSLPGAIISNSILMFFVCIFLFTLIISIIAWPVFWRIIWAIRWNLVSILSGTVINFIIKLIMNKLCYNFDHVKRRGLLSIFDFFLLQIAILAGIVSAITRFGIL